MNFGKGLAPVLLAFAVGCGRSGLDLLGDPPTSGPASGGEDATVGVGSRDAGPSSSGVPSSGGSSSSGSSGSGSGSTSSGIGSGSASGSGSGFGGSSACDSPSCAPGGAGMTNCGSNGDDCCCTSLEVTGGTFYRDYDLNARGYFVMAADGGPADEAAPASVSGFRLDKYLVTVGRFRQFVAAWHGGWLPPAGSGKHGYLNGGLGLVNADDDAGVEYETGWLASDDGNIAPTNANLSCYPGYDTWTNTAGSQENLPLNCVSWYDAYAFCIWDGGFLPSEAELEFAAAGGSQQREYPWGSTDPGTDSQHAIYDCSYLPSPPGAEGCGVAPVGMAALGAGLWGQLDLVGNVSEWNLDWGVFTSDTGIHYVDPCVDCANLFSEPPPAVSYGGRMAQGGDFTTPLSLISVIEAQQGNGGLPAGRYYGLGLRCARSP